MISYLKGKLSFKDPTHVIIDVNGVGYHVNISLATYGDIKDVENIMLHTYLHVKEDSHTLYGFSNASEKKMFLNLISISGVGPSTGLMIQSSLSSGELKQAIINEDVKVIQGVKGIGGKTAQRIILELKDKIRKEGLYPDESELTSSSHNTIRSEALSALITLGINKSTAEKSIDRILKNSGNTITLEELIKLTLKNA
ncbi:Holliday junction branch migration protein RuvA [Fulvivirga kasyanovii]|uniref:Holliday junction branch migration complex subunit RuvA n=1 Tax=Fulvivirga kasyanovii TaxID=396812 RepID=A0ABW9RR01_9BACT|nr:Holliday junction branch migration protein RuvA [Fulvivirga kasyanovii]MTI26612.1 Holliday junction branch migration protein RuvA [Fulvivirga kasyanovii]